MDTYFRQILIKNVLKRKNKIHQRKFMHKEIPFILFTTYLDAFLHKGGGEYELIETAFNLRKLGFIADIYSPFSRDIDVYNTIVHFSVMESSLPLVEYLKSLGKRIILWTNFWQEPPISNQQKKIIRRFFNSSDAIVFKSITEKKLLEDLLPDDANVLIVPCGVDICYTKPLPARLFRDSYGIEKFLLWVGNFEPRKRQLELIKLLSGSGFELVFVGDARDKIYMNLCRESAGSWCHFLSSLPHKSDMLLAAMRECELYIEMSTQPGGKSVLEAAIAGARIILPNSGWAREHFGDFPYYADLDDRDHLLGTLEKAIAKNQIRKLPAGIMERHLLPQSLNPLIDYILGGVGA